MTTRNGDSLRSPRILDAVGEVLARGVALGTSAAAAAATIRSAALIQMMGLRSSGTMTWPITRVPTRKAADAAPRIRPYSNGFSLIRGLAALTVSASASDVVGARAAACARAIRSTSQNVSAHMYVAAAAAAMTMALASTRRREASRSASRPSSGPAANRTSNATARIKPICCGVRPLLSNSFGQYGDATPKAPYRATYSKTYAIGTGNGRSLLVVP